MESQRFKFVFVLIVGYVIGNLLCELYVYLHTPKLKTKKYSQSTVNQLINFGQHNHSIFSKLEANKLHKKIKLLCWIMTNPENHQTKAIHVLRTWGRRCNKIILMSSAEDIEIPEVVSLPVNEGRDNLWAKTKAAFTYIYDHYYFDEYDWFLKADDDTYVVVENLRLLLNNHDPKSPIYYGYKFAAHVDQGYMSGGAGYVLSKEALRRFIEVSLPDPELCYSEDDGAEDLEMGKCLESVDVIAGDSRDKNKRGRFFVFPLEQHLLTEKIDKNFWYWEYMYYKTEDGLTCCSDYAISFHYVQPTHMYILDYLIYHTKPYGVKTDFRNLLN